MRTKRPAVMLVALLGLLGALALVASREPGWTTQGIRLDDAYSSYLLVGDRTLVVDFLSGDDSCWRNVDVAVNEGPDRVVVTATQEYRNESGWCSLSAPIQAMEVHLDQPLGDRAVIDGTSGNPIAPRE